MKFYSGQFPNFGYTLVELDRDLITALTEDVDSIYADIENRVDFSGELAGHLAEQYELTPDHASYELLEDAVLTSMYEYDNAFNFLSQTTNLTDDVPFKLHKTWINFQTKHEFNPVHWHSGVMSFVIWLKVPYDMKDEDAKFPRNVKWGNDNRNSRFEFLYTDTLGNIKVQPIVTDKSVEGYMCIFPSSMRHAVNPFYTSDGIRVSISGNVRLDTSGGSNAV